MAEPTTIAALASGQTNAALAIIRVSGPKAISAVGRCLEKEKFLKSPPGRIGLYLFKEQAGCSEGIDQVTAIKYLAPHSFTGEDAVEIICHGNLLIVRKILDQLIRQGCSPAKKGEFSYRAF